MKINLKAVARKAATAAVLPVASVRVGGRSPGVPARPTTTAAAAGVPGALGEVAALKQAVADQAALTQQLAGAVQALAGDNDTTKRALQGFLDQMNAVTEQVRAITASQNSIVQQVAADVAKLAGLVQQSLASSAAAKTMATSPVYVPSSAPPAVAPSAEAEAPTVDTAATEVESGEGPVNSERTSDPSMSGWGDPFFHGADDEDEDY